MPNIKLILEYDGTDFVGWQSQTNGPSIQDEIQRALRQMLQEDVTVIGAGRTDAGVHARGQVANFHTSKKIETRGIVKGLNALLPEAIAVITGCEVPPEFHARYNALGRRYCYHISQSPTAIWRRYSWELMYKLDVRLMNEAAKYILGDHDFRSFCKVESDVEHHRCLVQSATWIQDHSSLRFEIVANRFLHGMVRALVGTMVDIGREYRPLNDLETIVAARDRREAGMAAPAKGLFLEEIYYERSE